MTTNDSAVDNIFQVWNQFHHVCDIARFRKFFSRVELFRLIQNLPGDIIDVAAFKGVSTMLFAHLVETYCRNSRAKLLGFDTFDASMLGAREDETEGVDEFFATLDEPPRLQSLPQSPTPTAYCIKNV